MQFKHYKCTCLACGESDILEIDNSNHVVGNTERKLGTNFLSYRWRPDMIWGFMCKCGNDNRVSPQEADGQGTVFDGDPISIQKIADSLKIPDIKQFRLEPA